LPLLLPSTKIEVTVFGIDVDNTKSTLAGLTNVTPVARPVIVVSDVSTYVMGVEFPLTSTVIEVPAT
jgi:hypothetical protein